MDPKFRSSFIPKKPLPVKSTGKVKRRHSFNLIVFLSGVLFVAAIALAGAAFLYERVVSASVSNKGIELSQAKDRLDLKRIDDYRALGARLQVANSLMRDHRATSKLFELFNAKTLHDVAFKTYEIMDDFNEAAPKINLSGEAASFNALTVQKDELETEGIMTNIKIGEVSLEKSGRVQFEISGNLVLDKFLYKIESDE